MVYIPKRSAQFQQRRKGKKNLPSMKRFIERKFEYTETVFAPSRRYIPSSEVPALSFDIRGMEEPQAWLTPTVIKCVDSWEIKDRSHRMLADFAMFFPEKSIQTYLTRIVSIEKVELFHKK